MQRNHMGKNSKKTKHPVLLKHSCTKSSSWPWPSCNQPRTLSFRNKNEMIKIIDSAYVEATLDLSETSDRSFFTNSCTNCASLSTVSEVSRRGEDPIETVIRGLQSERLFFEPEETSSILQSKAAPEGLPFKESLLLSMESKDPLVDFRNSMEEMMAAHGVNDWEGLEELLSWYLRVNGKSNHGYIVGAFVDLLVGLAITGSRSSASAGCYHSSSSPLSLYASFSYSSLTAHCVSCLKAGEELHSTSCITSASTSILEGKKLGSETMDGDSTSSNV